ncbi:osmotically-inducible protein OsmY [Rhodoligotrophos appendicifer]|uniref:BON domain-containing protein n=1 Tax=Rhodoligotrophos appendicifer TaxID=987056 RepID=UPI0011851322|nr:BON domain-containing protein [Rhodoligotrophos appendicifer]
MKEAQLRQDILDELEFEPSIDAANIGVAVDDGVITLTGHVRSYAEKLAAEAAVRRVRGVRAIAQEIDVRYPGEAKTSDDEIAKRALDALKWDVTIPNETITLIVHHGLVTLKGEVPWQFQRKAAELAVRKMTGVTGVINDITLKPMVQSTDVKRKIEEALKRRAKVEASQIRVSVDGNKVTLEGKVDTWDEHDAVEHAAWSATGVKLVTDHLTVGR